MRWYGTGLDGTAQNELEGDGMGWNEMRWEE